MSSSAANGEDASDMRESPILIHVWETDAPRIGAAVKHLDRMLAEIAGDPGFLSGRVLASDDRRSIAAILQMRSVEDRRRLEERPVVREALDELDGTVNIVVRMYREVEAIGA